MIHRIKTVYGESETFYGEDKLVDWKNWAQGILQGNTSGLSVWSTLSSVVFDILHKRGFKSNIISSISKQLFTLVGFAYVDDYDLIHIEDNPNHGIRINASPYKQLGKSYGGYRWCY